MEIGNEISQKIRSAIKAKLVDLGAYVDDELPDYIMVMVANKKSQSQMTEDLNLFLGNNTEKFTSWLHGLLTKLQSITADPPKPPEAPPGGEAEDQKQDADIINVEVEEKFEEELTIRPEHDDFEEEARKESLVASGTPQDQKDEKVATPEAVVPQTPAVSVPKAGQGIKAASAARVSSRVTTKAVPSNTALRSASARKTPSPSEDTPSGPASGVKQTSANQTPVLQKQREVVRKRRAPGSVVASVIHHEEEEEYDPRRPLIGRVASKVKVGERRPTVPPGQQANKSLLLKAMTEAHKSISKTTQRLSDPGSYGINTQEDTEREAERRTTSRQSRTRAEGREPYGNFRSSSGIVRQVSHVTRQALDRKEGSSLRYKDDIPAERSIQLYSRSKREEVLQQLRAGLHSESEVPRGRPAPDTIDPIPDDSEPGDNRYVRIDKDSPSPEEKRTITLMPEEIKQETEPPAIETLIESGAEESDFTDEEQEPRIVQQKPPSPVPEQPPSSPKFVVTLDGVNPSQYMDTDQESDITLDDLPKPANIVRVAPQRLRTSTPIDMDYADADSEDGISPPKRSRRLERCKFWLACRNGNHCSYHHPTVPCKTFPNCKFGEKCLYIHPNCRFDASCNRDNCPFTHATKRIGAPVILQPFSGAEELVTPFNPAYISPPSTKAANPRQITCKFFPKCTNMNCTYRHPKPCRFGMSCRDKATCAFSHPELPKADQLRWEAPRDLSMESESER